MPRGVARVVLGGTFDRLHAGHQALLGAALRAGGPVAIGLTTDAYLRAHPKPDGRSIAPYSVRRRALRAWLRRAAPGGRWAVVPLNDPFGRSILPGAKVLVASVGTHRGAGAVNRERRRRGLPPLRTILVPLVLADDLLPITSTRVRAGIIDPQGRRRTPLRLAVWSSSDSALGSFSRAVRSVFPRGRVDAHLVKRPSPAPPQRQVRDWSRRALAGHDLAFGLIVVEGRRPIALLSERTREIELFPRRVTPADRLSAAEWARLLRPAAGRGRGRSGAPKG